ncbi:hypothetical protein TNCV_1021931 [Trichonephila clavipes]|nr:hypothetical protein TNCV_1021931 [Trichonephila clavipes]
MYCVIQVPNVTLWYGVPCLLSILQRSLLVVDDSGVAFKRDPIFSQLETDQLILQAKVTCQHSVECFPLQQKSEVSVFGIIRMSAPAVIGNWSPDLNSSVDPVCLGRMQFVCKRSPGFLTNTGP